MNAQETYRVLKERLAKADRHNKPGEKSGVELLESAFPEIEGGDLESLRRAVRESIRGM